MTSDNPESSDPHIVRRLLESVPGNPSTLWADWERTCLRLGEGIAPLCIGALRHGPDSTHYGALLALRLFGFEAWGSGHGRATVYEITPPNGKREWIKPDNPPTYPWEQEEEGGHTHHAD